MGQGERRQSCTLVIAKYDWDTGTEFLAPKIIQNANDKYNNMVTA